MNTSRPRPYWHVDLKWVFGIMAFASLWIALLLNAFSTLTEKQNATAVSTSVVTNIVASSGADVGAAIEQLKAQAAMLPEGAELTVPNMPWLKLTKADLVNKSSEEIQALAVSQLTNPIYEQGLDKTAEQLTADKVQQQAFKQQAGLLGVISKQTHDALVAASRVALATSVVWIVGLIFFSAGWGRMVSPGVVLMLVSPVGAVMGTLLEILSKKNESLIGLLPQSVITNLAHALNGTYRTAFYVGVGLLAAAGIGKLITSKLARGEKAV